MGTWSNVRKGVEIGKRGNIGEDRRISLKEDNLKNEKRGNREKEMKMGKRDEQGKKR